MNEYQPDYVIYEVQQQRPDGTWFVIGNSVEHDLIMAIAMARQTVKLYKRAVRIVKTDLRPRDPNRDCDYLKPSVIWCSHPTFPGMKDFWKP